MVMWRHKFCLLQVDIDKKKKAWAGPFRGVWELQVLLALIEESFSALAGVIRIKHLLSKWSVPLDPPLQPKCLPSLKGFPGGASVKEPACQCWRL